MSNNIDDYIEVLDNNNYEKVCSEEEYPKEIDSSCTIINEKTPQQQIKQIKNQSKLNKFYFLDLFVKINSSELRFLGFVEFILNYVA